MNESMQKLPQPTVPTSTGWDIGYSFQLAITAPLYLIIGSCIATAQS